MPTNELIKWSGRRSPALRSFKERGHNEKYTDKLKTYSSGPNYAKTLCKDFYHSNPDFLDFNNNLEKVTGHKFVHYDLFTPEAMEERTKLMYELVKIIWEVN